MHLTLTGFHAGKTLCGGARDGMEVHSMFAPLHKAEFRATVCPACLREYAMSYDWEEIALAIKMKEEDPESLISISQWIVDIHLEVQNEKLRGSQAQSQA